MPSPTACPLTGEEQKAVKTTTLDNAFKA